MRNAWSPMHLLGRGTLYPCKLSDCGFEILIGINQIDKRGIEILLIFYMSSVHKKR